MSVTEITNPQSWEMFIEKSANVVRFLAPVIEANRNRRDLPRDLQQALDFFLSIALADGLKLMAWAAGRDLTGRDLTGLVKVLRDRGEAGFDEILERLAKSDEFSPNRDFHFELLVGMRALIDDVNAIDLPLTDQWLCNFDWRDPAVQELRDLTCRARAGEVTVDHFLLSVRLTLDALELSSQNSEADAASENAFLVGPALAGSSI